MRMVVTIYSRHPLWWATSGPTSNPMGKSGSSAGLGLTQTPNQVPSLPKDDLHHPTIKLLMDPYLRHYNNFVNFPEILTLSGKLMRDLTTLPQYCQPTGQPFLYWNSGLGECFWGVGCKFYKGHLKIKKGEATDAFAAAVSECISKGVLYYTNLPAEASSPRNKHKGGRGTQEP
jgi:hypothetical protein